MVRISKDPDVRMNEILDAAERLFIKHGYDNTTVGSIVDEVGIAKGTFYYYFDTKESIISAIVERILNKGREKAEEITYNTELNAVQKMSKIMYLLLIPVTEGKGVLQCIDDESNAKIHQKRNELFHKIFKSIILKVVEEGIKNGLFECEHYQDITEIVFIGIDRFMHINIDKFSNKDVLYNKVMAIQELLEKVLGIREGNLDILAEAY